jgi:hypothetical protein
MTPRRRNVRWSGQWSVRHTDDGVAGRWVDTESHGLDGQIYTLRMCPVPAGPEDTTSG